MMDDFNYENYLPKEYSKPEEEHLFETKYGIYQGYTYVADRSNPIFQILDIGDNFISTLREYYLTLQGINLPDTKLYIINASKVNAFVTFEKELNSFCIGIFSGVCEEIEKNVRESLERVKGILFPEDDADKWYELSFVEALRFFVAHEYAHIVCGHITKEENTEQFEFSNGEHEEGYNLFQQMKEFQADQVAMGFLCGLTYENAQSAHNLRAAQYNQKKEQFWSTYYPCLPSYICNSISEKKRNEFLAKSKEKMIENRRKRLKAVMAGVNVVFQTFDTYRKNKLVSLAEKNKLSLEERDSYLFKSGLSTMREFDHPLPAIRLESVSRTIGEFIENAEPELEPEQLEDRIMDFAWVVEIYRNEFKLDALYCHIPHTPTAQDFIQEMECLWQKKKKEFEGFLPPLVRLFYANRIVDITDEGHLLY